VALTGILWLPAIWLYDLRSYPIAAGQAAGLFAFPVAYVVVTGLAMGATFALAPTRWAWLAASTAVVLALPRLFVYDVTFQMLGYSPSQPESRSADK
jgi:hypothetical protein